MKLSLLIIAGFILITILWYYIFVVRPVFKLSKKVLIRDFEIGAGHLILQAEHIEVRYVGYLTNLPKGKCLIAGTLYIYDLTQNAVTFSSGHTLPGKQTAQVNIHRIAPDNRYETVVKTFYLIFKGIDETKLYAAKLRQSLYRNQNFTPLFR